jgi:myo-inositol-1(or 4)-monophosphatase
MNAQEARLLTRMLSAARIAGKLLVEFRGAGSVALVDMAEFVTNADHTSGAVLKKRLGGGGIRYYSEETPGFPLDALRGGNAFVVDPIDGTRNYFHQKFDERQFWAVSIAYLEQGVTKLAVVAAPGRKQCYWAGPDGVGQYGCGPLAVSAVADLKYANVFGDWTKKKEDYSRCVGLLAKVAASCPYPMIAMSCAMAMIAVARGHAEAYFHTGLNIEDHAAAGLIVQAAGGKVTDLEGNPWTPFSTSILATNGHIHEQLLKILND